MRSALLFVALTLALSGCAGWVVFGHTIGEDHPAAAQIPPTEQPATATPPGQPAPATQPTRMQPGTPTSVGSVYIIVSPDARFDQQKLLAAVEQELQARRLLVGADAMVGSGAAANRRMEIDVDAFSTRASSNAVIFGYALGSGELAADIRLRDAEGRQISGFPVQAKARLATRPAEEDTNPLGNLYHRFAVLTADRLAGVPSKPDESEAVPR
jgi:hypothetical protein